MNSASAAGVLEPAEFDPFAAQAVERVIPTSEAQREVWLADKLSREASLAFNESVSLQLRGALDRRALQGALNGLLARHDALRCTIGPDGTELLVTAGAGLPMSCVDLQGRDPAERAAAIDRAQAEAVRAPFDLEQGPLVRAVLYALAPLEHMLLITAHHIVCDGWSWGVLTDDLGALYAEQVGAAPGPDPAPSYADYVGWETAQASAPEMAEHERYWLGRFTGSSLPVLDLMPDRARAPVRTFNASRVDHLLDAELVAEVRKLGARVGASAFAALFSGFAATLHRLTGQDDIVIGVPSAGQSASGMTSLIGHCVNLLPVRTPVDAAQPFDVFVQQSSTLLLDAFDHQTLTYGALLRKLPVRRDPSRLPLVSVMFNVDQAIRSSSDAFPQLQVEFATNPRAYENFELFVNAAQHRNGLCLECQFNTDLFDAATVRRWMGAYEALLRAAVAAPGAALGKLDWLADAERAALAALQPVRAQIAGDGLMHGAIVHQCAATPQRIALRHATQQLSYGELEQRSNRLAQVLRARGVQRGERVGLCLSRGIDMVVALLAVLKAGGTYVPLDPGFPQARLAYYAEDAGLALLVTESTLASAPLAWRSDAAERVLRLDRDDAWLKASDQPLAASALDADASCTAYVIYTSGSTGKPKGVCVPHAAAANFLASMRSEPGIGIDDRLAAVTTLSFDIAVLELLLPLTVGAQVVIVPRDTAMDGNLLRELLDVTGATMMQATPGMWRMLFDTPWTGGPGFKALVGGESLPPDLASDMLARCAEVWNMYGPTETTVWSTLWRVERDAVTRRGISIGRPIANTSVWILNAELQPAPIGVPGEICIGGDGVAQGYLDRPELSADRFIPDPFSARPGARLYRTGDRGRWRNDGLLEHLGRLDFQVKVRGYRIELGEIEAGCNDFPGVTQSVVLAREDNPGDVRLVAYLALSTAATADESGLRAHLRARLPEYMLPQHVVVLEAIPLLPNGKVDRKALPAPDISHVPAADRVAPRNELERDVARAMQGVLKLPEIGVHDDFFSLGGHSLLAARLIGQLNRELDLQLSLRTLFEAPTVAKLAEAIVAHRGAPAAPRRAPIVHRARQDRAPLSLMQERMRFIEEMHPGRVDYHTPSAHRLKGAMDVAAFDAAFTEMIRRQPALRTRIVATESGFVQQVEEDVHVSLLPVEDLSPVPAAEREALLKSRIDALMAQTFALDEAPLLKVRLFKLAPDEHALFFMPHHVVWDGWSFDLLYMEMSALYDAQLHQRKTALAPLALTYGDFAEWHNEWLKSDEIAQQKQFWKEQYAKAGWPREPFADRVRAPGTPSMGDTAWIRIEPAQVEQIRELAKKTGTTLSIVAMSAFTAIMSEWLDDTHPVIGLPVRGRPTPELEAVMGTFNNMLPMRMPVDTALSGLDWIRSVRQTLLHGYSNQDVPFELVARELDVAKRGAPARLYHVMFTFQDARQRPTHWGPLVHSRIPVDLKGVTEDINLWLVDAPAGIFGGILFDASLYMEQTGAGLRDRFVALLERMVRNPAMPLAQLLAADERELGSIAGWARPPAAQGFDLHGGVDRALAAAAQAPLFAHGERALTGRELTHRLAQAEQMMAALGHGAGATVAVCIADPLTQAVVGIAALRQGARVLMLDPLAPTEALRGALESTGVRWLIGDADTRPLVAPAAWIDAQTFGALAPQPGTAEPPDGDVVRSVSQTAVSAPVWGEAVAAARAALALKAGSKIVSVSDGHRGAPVFDALLALAAGGRWRSVDDAAALHRHLESRVEPVALLRAGPDCWRSLLAAKGSAWPESAFIDVRELPARLAADLHNSGRRVCTAWIADALGIPVAGGWQSRWIDFGVFGRPWLAGDGGALRIIDGRGQIRPIGLVGALDVRIAGSAVGAAAPTCRWRSDGCLQWLGTVPEIAGAHRVAPAPGVNDRAALAASACSPTERALIDVWESLLCQSGVRPSDNFFELGGTSLLAMRAVALLEKELGRNISARRYVFDSLSQLAAAYDAAPASAATALAAAAAAAGPAEGAAPAGLFKRLAGLVRRS